MLADVMLFCTLLISFCTPRKAFSWFSSVLAPFSIVVCVLSRKHKSGSPHL